MFSCSVQQPAAAGDAQQQHNTITSRGCVCHHLSPRCPWVLCRPLDSPDNRQHMSGSQHEIHGSQAESSSSQTGPWRGG